MVLQRVISASVSVDGSTTGKIGPGYLAKPLFDLFVQELSGLLGQPVPTGVFGADMRVELVNDGPVTVVLE